MNKSILWDDPIWLTASNVISLDKYRETKKDDENWWNNCFEDWDCINEEIISIEDLNYILSYLKNVINIINYIDYEIKWINKIEFNNYIIKLTNIIIDIAKLNKVNMNDINTLNSITSWNNSNNRLIKKIISKDDSDLDNWNKFRNILNNMINKFKKQLIIVKKVKDNNTNIYKLIFPDRKAV